MPSRNWKICEVPLDLMRPWRENPRDMSDARRGALTRSLERFGYVEPIVWNADTGHIVGGHQRYRVLLDKGVEKAKVVMVRLTPEEELAANLTLNNDEIQGEWDDPLEGLLDDVRGADQELFEQLGFDELYDGLGKGAAPPPDGDTECPCCGNKWDIGPEDVTVSSGA